jgi:hypothetical protein
VETSDLINYHHIYKFLSYFLYLSLLWPRLWRYKSCGSSCSVADCAYWCFAWTGCLHIHGTWLPRTLQQQASSKCTQCQVTGDLPLSSYLWNMHDNVWILQCLLLTEHLIGCKLDTGEERKRKSLCHVRLQTVSSVASKIDICDQNVCSEYKLGYWSVHWFCKCEHSIL